MTQLQHKEKEFLKLLEQYKGMIIKVASIYCADIQERKDLVQEISLHLWKSFERFDKNFSTSTWIYRISLNVSISYLRKEKSKSKYLKKYEESYVLDWPDEVEQDNLDLLHSLISKLNNGEKALIILHLEEKSNAEIAEIMGLSISNVSTKLSRIRQKLSKMVKIN